MAINDWERKVAGRDRRALWGVPSPDGQASETFEVDGARRRNARRKARRRQKTRQTNPSKIQAIQRFPNSRVTRVVKRPAIPGDAWGRFVTRHVGKWSTPHLIRGEIGISRTPPAGSCIACCPLWRVLHLIPLALWSWASGAAQFCEDHSWLGGEASRVSCC